MRFAIAEGISARKGLFTLTPPFPLLMPSSQKLYIGLMSGTSLDGTDAVLAAFGTGVPEVLAALHAPMDAQLRQELLALCSPGDDEIERLGRAELLLTAALAEQVQALLCEAKRTAREVRAIGCHGQTVRHRPAAEQPFTLQLCDPSLLAERTGITTVADFRRRDLAAGGQGAPLASAFHRAAFALPGQARLLLNIGGIANLTRLDGDGTAAGFDTGPGNLLLDAWCRKHWNLPFDRDGLRAGSGQLLPALLAQLMAHPFLALPPPKSTGREDFNPAWLRDCLAEHGHSTPEDVQATLAEFTARSIAQAISDHGGNAEEMFVCGGGACNIDLMARLQRLLPKCRVDSTAALGIDPAQVEAVAFAWLARQTIQGQPGNLPAVTGAAGERILGGVYPA